jgi:hypothetical protein
LFISNASAIVLAPSSPIVFSIYQHNNRLPERLIDVRPLFIFKAFAIPIAPISPILLSIST